MMNALVAFVEAEGGSAVPFPPAQNLVDWPAIFGDGTIFEFNKIALISLIAFAVPTIIFLMARGGSADQAAARGPESVWAPRRGGRDSRPGRVAVAAAGMAMETYQG